MSFGFPDPRPYKPGESRKAALRRLAAKKGWQDADAGRAKDPPSYSKTVGGRLCVVDAPDDEWWAYMFGYDGRMYGPRVARNPFGMYEQLSAKKPATQWLNPQKRLNATITKNPL